MTPPARNRSKYKEGRGSRWHQYRTRGRRGAARPRIAAFVQARSCGLLQPAACYTSARVFAGKTTRTYTFLLHPCMYGWPCAPCLYTYVARLLCISRYSDIYICKPFCKIIIFALLTNMWACFGDGHQSRFISMHALKNATPFVL